MLLSPRTSLPARLPAACSPVLFLHMLLLLLLLQMEEKQRKKRDERNDEWRRDFEEIVQTVNSGIVSERRDDAVSHGPRSV